MSPSSSTVQRRTLLLTFCTHRPEEGAGGSPQLLHVHTLCNAFPRLVLFCLRKHLSSPPSSVPVQSGASDSSLVSVQRLLRESAANHGSGHALGTWQNPPGTTDLNHARKTAHPPAAGSLKPTPGTAPVVHICLVKSQRTPCPPGRAALAPAWHPPCSKHCPGPAEEVSPPLSIFPGPRPQPRRGADGRRHKGKAITDSPSGQSTSARQHTELVPLLPAPCPAPQPSQSPRSQGSARPSLAALPCPELAGTEAI